jgi:hypothetical protein
MSDLIKSSDPASRKARVQTRLSGTSDALLYGNAVTRKTSAMRAQAEFSATTDAESDGMAVWRAMLSILRMFRELIWSTLQKRMLFGHILKHRESRAREAVGQLARSYNRQIL